MPVNRVRPRKRVCRTNVNAAKLYVDGALETISSSGSQSLNTSSAGIPSIGASNHANNYNFKGDIDEVRIYQTGKTAGEIATLATNSKQPAAAWYYRHYGLSFTHKSIQHDKCLYFVI